MQQFHRAAAGPSAGMLGDGAVAPPLVSPLTIFPYFQTWYKMNKMTAAAALCFASQNLGSFMWPETGAGARPGPLHHAASPCNNNLQLQPDTWPATRHVPKHTLLFPKPYGNNLRCIHHHFTYIFRIYLYDLSSTAQFKNVKLASHIFCSQVDIIRSWSCNDVMMMIVSNAITV